MAVEDFILKVSLPDLDGEQVTAGPLVHFSSRDQEGKIVNVRLRQLKSIADQEICGVYVEDGCLIPLDENLEYEMHSPKFLKQIDFYVGQYKMSVLLFEDRCQFSVIKIYTDKVVASGYKSFYAFGSIKHLMESCASAQDVEDMLDKLAKVE
jgi:hypothetical protein